jgi:hypothetical protein
MLMRNVRTVALAAAMAIGLVGVSACAPGASAPSKASYIAYVNSVCDSAHTDVLGLLAAEKKDDGDITKRELFVQTVLIPRLKQMLLAMSGVPTPTGDFDYLRSIYTDYIGMLDIWYQYPSGTQVDAPRQQVEGRLRDYGLTGCVGVAAARPGDPKTLPTTTTAPVGG